METIENKTFQNDLVTVDDRLFKGCTFHNTGLVYGGGGVPQFTECRFESVRLEFTGAARQTLQFLSVMQRGGFTNSVTTVFNAIRGVQSE